MKIRWLFLITLALLTVEPVWAAKYISDVLWVSLRDTASDSASSIKVLKSGTKLEVLDKAEVDGYLHVSTSNGEQGWIKSRYLIDEPVAALRLSQLEAEVSKLTAENSVLKADMKDFKKNSRETDKERKRMISENKILAQENQRLTQLAAEPARLAEEVSVLKTKNEKLMADYEQVKSEVDNTNYAVQRTWFMTGAGVLFAGIILGLIFPSLRLRRRNTWS